MSQMRIRDFMGKYEEPELTSATIRQCRNFVRSRLEGLRSLLRCVETGMNKIPTKELRYDASLKRVLNLLEEVRKEHAKVLTFAHKLGRFVKGGRSTM